MKRIKTTYLAVVPSLIWSMFFMWIPSIIIALSISTSKYEYDDNNLTIQKGILTKHQTNVPFYRIYDVTSKENILGYGTITFYDKTKNVKINYVHKPTEVAKELRKCINLAREKDVTVTELL